MSKKTVPKKKLKLVQDPRLVFEKRVKTTKGFLCFRVLKLDYEVNGRQEFDLRFFNDGVYSKHGINLDLEANDVVDLSFFFNNSLDAFNDVTGVKHVLCDNEGNPDSEDGD